MNIVDLSFICDNIGTGSIFYCYDNREDYECNFVEFARLSFSDIVSLYPHENIIRFYVNRDRRIDILFSKSIDTNKNM